MAGRQRRERAELRAQDVRRPTGARLRRWTQPWPQPPGTACPAHKRGPAARRGADDRKRTVLRPDQPSGPAAVRPRSQRGGDHTERVEVPPGDLSRHDEHDRPACAAHVATRQDLRDLDPMRSAYERRPWTQAVPVQHQAHAHRPARGATARAVRRPRQLHAGRALLQPLLDVYAGSDNSKLAPSFQTVRSTTGATRLATRGPRHLFRRPALHRCPVLWARFIARGRRQPSALRDAHHPRAGRRHITQRERCAAAVPQQA